MGTGFSDESVAPVEGTYYRCVVQGREPLSTGGSRAIGGRFNMRGRAALYVAGTPELALRESVGASDLVHATRFRPRLVVCIDVRLSRAIDLTDPAIRGRAALTDKELFIDWRSASDPIATQLVGEAARAEGIEGILFPSSIDPALANLVVYRENLLSASRLEVSIEGA